MLRTNIEFSCDMPYDAVEGDGGEFFEMPARTVAQAMAGLLLDLGCAVEAVEDAGDHGWIFRCKFKSVLVTCEVTAIDGIVAQCFGPTGRAPSPEYAEILTAFGEALVADSRFHDVGWFGPKELTCGQIGARTPTGEYDPAPCRRTFGLSGADLPAAGPGLDAQTLAALASLDEGWSFAGPAQRLGARMFDHLVVVGGTLLLAISLLRIPPPLPTTLTFDYNGYLLFFSVALGGGLMNALLLPRISTTPGKWLCQVRVVRTDDPAPLSTAAALKREMEAVVAGCAMFVPLLMPLTLAFTLWRWLYFGGTGWDRRQRTYVEQAPISLRGLAATAFCLVSSFSVFWLMLGTWNLDHAAR